MSLIRAGAALLAVLGLVLVARPVQSNSRIPPGYSINKIAWLVGCLELRDGDRLVEEGRMAIRQGSMLGMARTTSSQGLGDYELSLIRERDGKLLYEAHPSGQEGAIFTAVALSKDSVVFSDPEHDYPQLVGYKRIGADSVLAWIDGKMQGKPMRVEFPYRRVACAGDR